MKQQYWTSKNKNNNNWNDCTIDPISSSNSSKVPSEVDEKEEFFL